MSPDIIIALISGLCVAIPSIIATIFSRYHNSKKSNEAKNVMLYRLEELEKR